MVERIDHIVAGAGLLIFERYCLSAADSEDRLSDGLVDTYGTDFKLFFVDW
ncbi:hypothetical protein K0504_10440 [Neiella marina]|uniref:Uncharacterized protein n=1 Tax=Neiella holothuriorum TaxID=2870530 RepID=A0ABS7EGH7_9GAMM|nr:hypothetical protein [Neiella holothuriorum]MBW8191454.1 hypothetical protein [Neiella holothuriorum]